MRKTTLTLLAILAALVLATAGCGDDDDSDDGGSSDAPAQEESSGAEGNGADKTEASGGGAAKLTLVADPGGALKFDKTELTAKPGKVTILMENQSDVPHAVEVEGNGVEEETDTVTGANAEVTVDLKAGEYKFYCPVGNHAQAGMEGTLTVR